MQSTKNCVTLLFSTPEQKANLRTLLLRRIRNSVMTKSFGYAAQEAGASLTPFSFERREVGACDILLKIQFCGICHSDIHQVRNEWGGSIYPMVPGHEIVGRVTQVGA